MLSSEALLLDVTRAMLDVVNQRRLQLQTTHSPRALHLARELASLLRLVIDVLTKSHENPEKDIFSIVSDYGLEAWLAPFRPIEQESKQDRIARYQMKLHFRALTSKFLDVFACISLCQIE
jgi:hypothetical protein